MKSNEITAIPQLLEVSVLQGCLKEDAERTVSEIFYFLQICLYRFLDVITATSSTSPLTGGRTFAKRIRMFTICGNACSTAEIMRVATCSSKPDGMEIGRAHV